MATGASVVNLDSGEMLAVARMADCDLVLRVRLSGVGGTREDNAGANESGCDSTSDHDVKLPGLTKGVKGFLEGVISCPGVVIVDRIQVDTIHSVGVGIRLLLLD